MKKKTDQHVQRRRALRVAAAAVMFRCRSEAMRAACGAALYEVVERGCSFAEAARRAGIGGKAGGGRQQVRLWFRAMVRECELAEERTRAARAGAGARAAGNGDQGS